MNELDKIIVNKRMIFIISTILKENKNALYESLKLNELEKIEMDLTIDYLHLFSIKD